jgi:hypothetical protein
MKLAPCSAAPAPAYPPRRCAAPVWRRFAVAVATSTALWLPACGADGPPPPERLGGVMPQVEDVRLPGQEPVTIPPVPPPKPPESTYVVPWPAPAPPQVVPDPTPEPRLAGVAMPATPLSSPPPKSLP